VVLVLHLEIPASQFLVILESIRWPSFCCFDSDIHRSCIAVIVCSELRRVSGGSSGTELSYRHNDVHTCVKCDKVYSSRRELGIHQSYCCARL